VKEYTFNQIELITVTVWSPSHLTEHSLSCRMLSLFVGKVFDHIGSNWFPNFWFKSGRNYKRHYTSGGITAAISSNRSSLTQITADAAVKPCLNCVISSLHPSHRHQDEPGLGCCGLTELSRWLGEVPLHGGGQGSPALRCNPLISVMLLAGAFISCSSIIHCPGKQWPKKC